MCLQSGYAHGVHQMRKQLYYERSLIEKYGYIPNGDNTEVDVFWVLLISWVFNRMTTVGV